MIWTQKFMVNLLVHYLYVNVVLIVRCVLIINFYNLFHIITMSVFRILDQGMVEGYALGGVCDLIKAFM